MIFLCCDCEFTVMAKTEDVKSLESQILGAVSRRFDGDADKMAEFRISLKVCLFFDEFNGKMSIILLL